MKKICALVLTTAMLLSFASCGRKDTTKDTKTTEANQTQTSESTTAVSQENNEPQGSTENSGESIQLGEITPGCMYILKGGPVISSIALTGNRAGSSDFNSNKTAAAGIRDIFELNEYVDMYSSLHPRFITFHYEASEDVMETIGYIKDLGMRVGIAISPETKVEAILPYLPRIDLVLVMSVVPGMGGQEFMLPTIRKLAELKNYRMNSDLNFLISVDGGINDNTIKLVRSADIVVSGSFITKGDINHNINVLKNI